MKKSKFSHLSYITCFENTYICYEIILNKTIINTCLTPDASCRCKHRQSSIQNILKYFDSFKMGYIHQVLKKIIRGEKQLLQFLRRHTGLPSLRNPGQSFGDFLFDRVGL